MKVIVISLLLSGLFFCCADAATKIEALIEDSKKNQTSLNHSVVEFRKNYDKARFVFHGPFIEDGANEFVEHPRSIHLKNFDVIKYLMQQFGHMVHKIHINFEQIEVEQAHEIVQIINNHSKSIETLALEHCKGNILDNLNNTFPYLFTLKFSSSPFHQLEVNSEFKLNQIFTELSALHLEHTNDFNFIGEKWPNLGYLNVKLRKWKDQNHEDTSRIIPFLRDNPHIEHLQCHNCNLNLIKMANEILSKLNFLNVVNLSEDYGENLVEPIQLDDVRMLTVEIDNEYELPGKMIFGKLARFKLIIKKFTDKWSEFLTNQVNADLMHFNLECEEIKKEQFRGIAEIMPNLEAIDVICTSGLESDDIVGFIVASKSLKNFDLHIHMNETEMRHLSEALPRDWDILDHKQQDNKVKISLKWESPITENDILSHLGVDSSHIIQQDCSPAVLNNLNIIDLLKMSSINDECMDAVRKVFQKNYHKSTFILCGPFVSDGAQVIEEKKNVIYLHHYNLIAYIFNNFGYSIHNVEIFFEHMDLHQSRRIIRKVIDKCAESLETFTIDNYDRSFLDELNVEFPYVSSLIFSTAKSDLVESVTTSRSMNKIFQNLLKLHVNVAAASDWEFIDGHFSQLNEFSVQLSVQNEEIITAVAGFFTNNPQIVTLVVQYGRLSLLNEANDILRQLKNLELKNMFWGDENYGGAKIHLNTIQHLLIESVHEDRISKMAIFPQLNTLHLKLQHEFTDKWAKFLSNQVNTKLSKFSLVSEGMATEHLLDIPDKQSSLQSVNISSDIYLAADDIMKLIGKSKRLSELQLKVQMEKREQYHLVEIVPLDWDLESADFNNNNVKLSLERLKECPSTSLVRLDLIDLLKRSNAFKECQDDARQVFTAKYEKFPVIIRGPFDKNAQNEIGVQDESIYLTNFNVIKHFLREFGDLVRQIRVSFDEIDETQAIAITKYINDKCSITLETLSLTIQEESVLRELRHEFRNVFALSISSQFENEVQNGSHIIQLNIVFPNLLELHLDSTTLWTIVDEVMPQLKKFNVHLPKEKFTNDICATNVTDFLKKNPQIEHLSIQNGNFNLLREVKAILIQLVSLDLMGFAENYIYYDGDQIHFETVRHLSIDLDTANRVPTKIVFKHLERLRLVVQMEFTKQWLEFLEGQINPGVKQLDMEFAGLSIEYFLELPGKLRDLEVAKITCDSSFAADDVVRFIEKTRQISNLVLNIRMDPLEQTHLQELLGRKWHITYQPGEDQMLLIDIKLKSQESSSLTTSNNLSALLEKPFTDGKSNKAEEIFKSKYLQSKFIIRGPFVENMPEAIEEYNNGDWVIIHNSNAIESLLKNFGHFGIKTIEIDFQEIDAENGKKIVEYIDKIAKSLNILYLENCKDILNGLKSEFTNLSVLRFSSRDSGVKIESNKLSKLFPNLQRFYIDHTDRSDWNFIDCHLPKLTQLDVKLSRTGENGVDESQIGTFLKVNPQIERLKLEQSNLRLIAEANEHLPHLGYLRLEQLSTEYFNHPGNPIHFNHLKHFSLRSYHVNEIPEKIVFEKLEKLDLILYPNQFTDKWSEFLNSQVNADVNEFSLNVGKITTAQLFSIPGKLQNLKKISISSSSEFTAEEIVDFIKKSSSLVNLNFECFFEKWEQDRLNELLPIKFKLNMKMQRDDIVKITVLWEQEKLVDPLNTDEDSNGDNGSSENSISNTGGQPNAENRPNNSTNNDSNDGNGAPFLLANCLELMIAVTFILAIYFKMF